MKDHATAFLQSLVSAKVIERWRTLSADEIVRREAETRERSLVGEAILMSGERKKGRAEGIGERIKKGIKEHAVQTARRIPVKCPKELNWISKK